MYKSTESIIVQEYNNTLCIIEVVVKRQGLL